MNTTLQRIALSRAARHGWATIRMECNTHVLQLFWGNCPSTLFIRIDPYGIVTRV